MGKGNRNRNDRYEDIYSMSGSGAAVKSAKGGAKKDRTTALLITVIAVLLLAALAIYIFADSGVLERNTVYVSSENFEVTGTMLPYYENLAYSSTFEQYYYLYYNYYYSGDAAKAYNAVAQLMSGYTLNDFFDSAVASAKELVALAEEAVANDVALDEEDVAEIEESLKGFSASSLGTGVKKKDVRKALELQYLASKYATELAQKLENDVTEEDILAYVAANKANYYTADALKYDFVLKAEDYEDDGVAYVAAEKLADRFADALNAASSADEFKKLVIEYEVEKGIDALIAENKGSLDTPDEAVLDAAKAELVENLFEAVVKDAYFDSGVTDNATYAELFETVATKLYATCISAVADIETSESYSAAADDEAIAWLSEAETKEGDTKLFENSTEEEYSKSVYIVTKAMHLDESATKDVAHILIKAEKDKATEAEKAAAKEKAEKALAEFLAGEQTLEAFEKLAETYNEDSGCVYEGVKEGQMVEEFEDWTFDGERKTGDTGVVETQFGYHVMYFIGEGKAAYYVDALDNYISDKYTELVEELTEKHVVLNDKAIAKNTNEKADTAA